METLELSVAEEVTETPAWSDPPPPRLEEQEFDNLAFGVWQRGSRRDAAAEEDCPDEEAAVGAHASCL